MTVTVRIGSESRAVSDASERWINEQLRRRGQDGGVCVEVGIESSGVNLRLTTPGCPRGVGSRQANENELEIIALWQRHHLNDPDFTGGNVIAFLKNLKQTGVLV